MAAIKIGTARSKDVITHHHGSIDLYIVWNISANPVPRLKTKCEAILSDITDQA